MAELADLLPALPWALAWLALPLLQRRSPQLTDAPRARAPRVSVIIPARNEAANIERVLTSLRASTYPDLEILVVDDRSADDTFAIASRVAGADPRVRVLAGAELPSGWFGKPWACVQGFRGARGELLLFTDADTWHAPDALEHAVGAMHREDAGMVTVITGLDCLTFWERVAMPMFLVPLAIRYHPQRINRARHARDVIANGQFILVQREAYLAAGTHEAVRGEVAEDLMLSQVWFRKGFRSYIAFAEDLVRTRMYTGLGQIVEGWSKNFYLGGRASFPDEPVWRALVPVAASGAAVFWIAPAAWLVAAPGPAAVTAFLLATGFWALVARGMRIPGRYGLSHPLGAAVLLYIAVRSAWRGDRRVEWRGRRYAGGTHVR